MGSVLWAIPGRKSEQRFLVWPCAQLVGTQRYVWNSNRNLVFLLRCRHFLCHRCWQHSIPDIWRDEAELERGGGASGSLYGLQTYARGFEQHYQAVHFQQHEGQPFSQLLLAEQGQKRWLCDIHSKRSSRRLGESLQRWTVETIWCWILPENCWNWPQLRLLSATIALLHSFVH